MVKVTLYAQPLGSEPYLNMSTFGAVDDESTVEQENIKALTDIGRLVCETAQEIDDDASIAGTSLDGTSYEWGLRIEMKNLDIDLISKSYKPEPLTVKDHIVKLVLNGKEQKIQEFVQSLVKTLDRVPYEIADWKHFSKVEKISKDQALAEWSKVLGGLDVPGKGKSDAEKIPKKLKPVKPDISEPVEPEVVSEDEEIDEKTGKKRKVKVKIRKKTKPGSTRPCPKCKTIVEIDPTQDPIIFVCPNCGLKGKFKRKKVETPEPVSKPEPVKKIEELPEAVVVSKPEPVAEEKPKEPVPKVKKLEVKPETKVELEKPKKEEKIKVKEPAKPEKPPEPVKPEPKEISKPVKKEPVPEPIKEEELVEIAKPTKKMVKEEPIPVVVEKPELKPEQKIEPTPEPKPEPVKELKPKPAPEPELPKEKTPAEKIIEYIEKAEDYKNRNMYHDAIRYYDLVLDLDPENIQALNNKGLLLWANRKYRLAIEHFDRVIELDKYNPEALINKAASLNKLGEKEEALKTYDIIIDNDKENTDAWSNKGVLLYTMQNFKEAEEAFKHAVSGDPGDEDSWLNLAIVLEKNGKYQEAMEAYDKVISLNPNNKDAVYGREECQKSVRREMLKDWQR